MMKDGTILTAKEHAEFLTNVKMGQMVQVGSYTMDPLAWGPTYSVGIVTKLTPEWVYVQGIPFDRINGFSAPPEVAMGEVRATPFQLEHFIEPMARVN